MKNVKTMVLAASVLLFVTGAAHAVDMDDLDVTIKMIDSDDVKGASHELRLPDAASDVAREHAEKRDGKGLSRANEVHDRNDSRKEDHGNKTHDDKDHAADKKDDHDEHKSSRDDSMESHDEAKESQEEMKEEQSESHDESKDDHTDAKEDMDDKTDSTNP